MPAPPPSFAKFRAGGRVRLYERDGAFMGSPSGAGAALCVRAAVRSDGRGRIREIVTPVRSAMRKKRISRMWGERCRTKRRARDSPGEAREAWGAEAPGSSSARYTFGTTDRQAPWRGPRPTRRVGYSLAPFTSPPRAGGRLPPLGSSPAKSGPAVSGVAKADLPIPASPKRPGIIQTSQKLADFPLFTFLDYTGPLS